MLCIDPGNETGLALFVDGELVDTWQCATAPNEEINWANLESIFERAQPTHVVCEDYRVYQHKLDQHTFSRVTTVRLIGVVDYLCWQDEIGLSYQMAMQAKGFCTDKKLQMWGLWQKGMRHSRDAIRHGVYFLLFNKEEVK